MFVHPIGENETWLEKQKRKLLDKKEEVKEKWDTTYKKPVQKAATVIGFMTILNAVAGIPKRRNLKMERELKDKRIYDHSLGLYWSLRRKPSSAEMRIIENRRKAGEIYSDILSDLGLI